MAFRFWCTLHVVALVCVHVSVYAYNKFAYAVNARICIGATSKSGWCLIECMCWQQSATVYGNQVVYFKRLLM